MTELPSHLPPEQHLHAPLPEPGLSYKKQSKAAWGRGIVGALMSAALISASIWCWTVCRPDVPGRAVSQRAKAEPPAAVSPRREAKPSASSATAPLSPNSAAVSPVAPVTASQAEPEQPATKNSTTETENTEPPPSHPLILDVDRTGYDVYAEIVAALHDRAFSDAVKLILETDPANVTGLLPDVEDPQLALGYPAFVKRCSQCYPQIAAGLRENESLGRLRWQTALASGNESLARAVASQFQGTGTAAEANRWLGDQRLSEGKFRSAASYYRRSLESVSPEDRAAVTSRLRLAAAMLGQWAGRPASSAMDYRGMQLSAGELEQFVRDRIHDLLERGDSPGWQPAAEIQDSVPPQDFQTARLAEVDVPVARTLQEPGCEIDWSARGMATSLFGKLLIVSSRNQLEAIDVRTGRQRWMQPFDELRTYPVHWSWTAYRMLLLNGRLYVRHLPRGLSRLACLTASDGRVQWETDPIVCAATDPVYADGRLAILEIDVDDPFQRRSGSFNQYAAVRHYGQTDRPLQLSLLLINMENGQIDERFPLVRFHQLWKVMCPCRSTAFGNNLIVSAGGATLRIGLDGRVHWVRQHPYQRPGEAPEWFYPHHAPPLIIDDCAVVTQPGVSGVQCLDLATGVQRWSCDTKLRRLIGCVNNFVIVQCRQAFQAIDLETGQTAWQHVGVGPTEAVLCGRDGLVYADCKDKDTDDWHVVLRWLDPRTGQLQYETVLDGLMGERRITHMPYLGPILPCGDKLILGCERGQRRSQPRELYLLTPQGTTE